MLLFAFNSVATQNNCRELSDPYVKRTQPPAWNLLRGIRCVRGSLASWVERTFFRGLHEGHTVLPYSCFLTPEPTVPYHSDCVTSSQQCNRRRERRRSGKRCAKSTAGRSECDVRLQLLLRAPKWQVLRQVKTFSPSKLYTKQFKRAPASSLNGACFGNFLEVNCRYNHYADSSSPRHIQVNLRLLERARSTN